MKSVSHEKNIAKDREKLRPRYQVLQILVNREENRMPDFSLGASSNFYHILGEQQNCKVFTCSFLLVETDNRLSQELLFIMPQVGSE